MTLSDLDSLESVSIYRFGPPSAYEIEEMIRKEKEKQTEEVKKEEIEPYDLTPQI
jgi:hypothetical protein